MEIRELDNDGNATVNELLSSAIVSIFSFRSSEYVRIQFTDNEVVEAELENCKGKYVQAVHHSCDSNPIVFRLERIERSSLDSMNVLVVTGGINASNNPTERFH